MNPRERNLLMVLAGILVAGMGLYAGWRWFWVPLKDHNTTIARLKQDNEFLADTLEIFERDRKRLAVARLRSLPANKEQASLEYRPFLTQALRSSGLSFDQISHSDVQDVRVVTAIPGVKKTGHQVMEFKVQAHGELSQLVAALKRIHETPYEHRIKSLNIDRVKTAAGDTGSELVIRMTIEALLVARTTNKPGMELAKLEPLSPPSEDRNYASIADKNIFVGAVPKAPTYVKPKPKPKDKVEIAEVEVQPDVNVPAFVRLTQTVPDQQEAFLRNLIYNTREIRLIAKPRSGFQEFRIIDADTDYVFFKAKVLRVDIRDVYFQVFDDVYGVHIGQSLGEAMLAPLSLERLDDLDLERDRDWGKKEKEDAAKKKKGNGRSGR